jgi:hypothetical protein
VVTLAPTDNARRLAADNARLRAALTALLAQHEQSASWAGHELAAEQARQALDGQQDGADRD